MANEISRNGSREVSRDLSADMLAKLRSGFQASITSTPIGLGGLPILRLLKSGQWVFGQGDDPVQDGSEWAINPLSVKHGWSCWSNYPGNAKNQLLGEVMAPATDPKPGKPADIDGFEFKEQRIFDARCTNGTDEGVEVVYKVASWGGVAACNDLMAAFLRQLDIDDTHPVPIVQFDKRPYQHSKWGQVFNPAFTIVGWANMHVTDIVRDGDEPEAEAPKAAAAEKPPLRPGAPPRRQRPTGRV